MHSRCQFDNQELQSIFGIFKSSPILFSRPFAVQRSRIYLREIRLALLHRTEMWELGNSKEPSWAPEQDQKRMDATEQNIKLPFRSFKVNRALINISRNENARFAAASKWVVHAAAWVLMGRRRPQWQQAAHYDKLFRKTLLSLRNGITFK